MKFGMILVGCFIIHIKAKDVYKDIANDVEKNLIHQVIKSIDHDQ